MEIKLDNKNYLKSDSNSFSIGWYEDSKAGKKFHANTYYVSLKSALIGYIDIRLKDSKAKKVSEIVEELRKLDKEIQQIYNKIDEAGDVNFLAMKKLIDEDKRKKRKVLK